MLDDMLVFTITLWKKEGAAKLEYVSFLWTTKFFWLSCIWATVIQCHTKCREWLTIWEITWVGSVRTKISLISIEGNLMFYVYNNSKSNGSSIAVEGGSSYKMARIGKRKTKFVFQLIRNVLHDSGVFSNVHKCLQVHPEPKLHFSLKIRCCIFSLVRLNIAWW